MMSIGLAWQIAIIFLCFNCLTETIDNIFLSFYLIATGITAFAMTLLGTNLSNPVEIYKDGNEI